MAFGSPKRRPAGLWGRYFEGLGRPGAVRSPGLRGNRPACEALRVRPSTPALQATSQLGVRCPCDAANGGGGLPRLPRAREGQKTGTGTWDALD